ncbi:alpha/beta hydrolase [Spirulina subsalsa]|uniref:alpha/beta hydrolase n=1 Tax=Spirulina subsalsa TaxID=54311 RepID=UPI0013DF9454|nr:alpha/beta hydrolase [Spirulina subsalsa]
MITRERFRPRHGEVLNPCPFRFTVNRWRGFRPSPLQTGLASRITKTCLGAIALLTLAATPGAAAEQLVLKMGWLETTVSIEELSQFVRTGEVSPSLERLTPLLTPQVRELLGQHLAVNPDIADSFLNKFLQSQDGRRLLEDLQKALPGSSGAEIKAALYLTLRQAEDISILGFLQTYPYETLTIDAIAATSIALQLNASRIQSQLLGPALAKHLQSTSGNLASFAPPFDPTLPGPEQVRQRSLRLHDRQRRRRIPVDLYYSSRTRGPVVVLSHGFAADRRFLSYLAHHLASYGFSVVALEHPGSNIDNLAQIGLELQPTDVLPAAEFRDRPADVSFVLDELERLRETWGYLGDKFNTQEVVMIGHSLGGYTALALAGGELDLKALRSYCQRRKPLGRAPADWLQCAGGALPHSKLRLRDSRVVKAIALNPVVGHLFGEKGLEQVETPTFILSHTEDAITPALDHQLRPFQQLTTEKYLLTISGATHMSATNLAHSKSTIAQSTWVREVMGDEAEPVREAMKGITLALVNQHTPQSPAYRHFLTPTYVESLSTGALEFRLTQDIPRPLGTWLEMIDRGNQQLVYYPEANPSPSLLARVQNGWDNLWGMIRRPDSCLGQLNRIFTSLLSNDPA